MPMDWSKSITTAAAFIGVVLSIYNTVDARRRGKSRIRVSVGPGDHGYNTIRVSNLSPHPVTVTRLESLDLHGASHPWSVPATFLMDPPVLPCRIEGRDTQTFPTWLQTMSGTRPQVGAYAETACGAHSYDLAPLRGVTRLRVRFGWRQPFI
ncbi:hypothetical protein WK73_05735 [Burkholderia ubonensis]|nr:hypothetical protein WK56_26635 [Burkholderia ubonensis]KVU79351.1 hypothetical protein WK73_05735 [Burkholderia ubonensis]KVZ10900.1 hypothetical protein WL12_00370 [Burkholderia ubonensis]KWE71758.1 hypothetical protein WL78_12875 [Burkholderia ubonensis]